MIHSPPEVSYARGLTHRIAALLAVLPLLAGILLLRHRLGPDATGVLALATLLGLLLFWRHEAGKVVEIHPEGLVLRNGTRARALRWESVREIRYRAQEARGGGMIGFLLLAILRRSRRNAGTVDERSVSIRCILRDEQDRAFFITSACRGAGDAVERILAKVIPRLQNEALHELRTRGLVGFGPIALTSDTIAREGRVLRFPEVSAWGLDRGKFFVKKEGAWLTAIQVPVARIPNLFVLLALLRHLDVPGGRKADLGSATFVG